MKTARNLQFALRTTPKQVTHHVVRVRLAECLALQHALSGNDDEVLHAFRLASKRLRYALERDQTRAREFAAAVAMLAHLTDELGWAHDCMELNDCAQRCAAPITAIRARRDRNRYAARAKRLWRDAFRPNGALSELARYAGFPG